MFSACKSSSYPSKKKVKLKSGWNSRELGLKFELVASLSYPSLRYWGFTVKKSVYCTLVYYFHKGKAVEVIKTLMMSKQINKLLIPYSWTIGC